MTHPTRRATRVHALLALAALLLSTPAALAGPVDDLSKESVHERVACQGAYVVPVPPPSGTPVTWGCAEFDVLRSVHACDDSSCTYAFEVRILAWGSTTRASAELCLAASEACVRATFEPARGPYVNSAPILVTVPDASSATATTAFAFAYSATFLFGSAAGATSLEVGYPDRSA